MRAKDVTLLRCAKEVVVEPTTKRIFRLLAPELSYVERKFFHGYERTKRVKKGKLPFQDILWEVFGEDHKKRLVFPLGFVERVTKILEKAGYTVTLKWADREERLHYKELDQTVYKPRWDKIEEYEKEGFKFRYKQRRCLELIAEREFGRIECPPAWGKGTEILLACMLFPQAKIAVVTKNVAVLQQRLYPELCLNLPSVGIVGGGKKVKGRRVMCYTADSLHHAAGDEDFVFIDEGHQACADKFAATVGAKFEHARIWMFSATWNMRLDNKDMRAEALAGPVRLRVPYHKAVEHNMVVPIEVVMSDVIMDINPCSGLDGVDKKRAAYWTNEYRNGIIAHDARLYDDDVQTLITVDTLEHGLHLKKLLPEFELVYNPNTQTPKDWREFRKEGLIDSNFRILTDERRERLTSRFTKSRLKKAIVTTVWNVGVNFKQLAVLIRGDGGGSPINDTQIPGRTSRTHEESGKQCGIIHDYLDQFDTGCKLKAQGRVERYTANRWKVHVMGRANRSKLRKLMQWGDAK